MIKTFDTEIIEQAQRVLFWTFSGKNKNSGTKNIFPEHTKIQKHRKNNDGFDTPLRKMAIGKRALYPSSIRQPELIFQAKLKQEL